MKTLIKAICRVLRSTIENEDYGYEMDCLISAEFTPAPDYSGTLQKAEIYCQKYNLSIETFMKELEVLANKSKAPYQGMDIYADTLMTLQYAIHQAIGEESRYAMNN